jgi:hypothetical protein
MSIALLVIVLIIDGFAEVNDGHEGLYTGFNSIQSERRELHCH